MKTNNKKMQEFFGEKEIHICCVANKNKVGCCSIDTTKTSYENIEGFNKETEELKDNKLTSVSSIIYSIKMLNSMYEKDPDAIKGAKIIHLMVNDASYTSYINSSKYGNMLGKVLNEMIEATEIEKTMCQLIKQTLDTFPNLIIDPVSVGGLASEDSDLKCLISQAWDLVLGEKAIKKKRSKFADK